MPVNLQDSKEQISNVGLFRSRECVGGAHIAELILTGKIIGNDHRVHDARKQAQRR